jgi:spermidine synthase
MTRGLVLVLTLLTGFTGLVYEVAWQKYLATLLGSHSEATAAVLGIFLGGLSVGYALFGRVSRKLVERSRGGSALGPLAVYGAVEALIGFWALLFPIIFRCGSCDFALDSARGPRRFVCVRRRP